VFAIMFGVANGLITIARGAVPLALFGAAGYGGIIGRIAGPALIVTAVAPVVIKTFPKECNDPLPAWIIKARDDRNAPPMFAKAISRYHDGEIPYIKLLDGGLVDNFGPVQFHHRAAFCRHALWTAFSSTGGQAKARTVPGRRCQDRRFGRVD
jgi:hypothetical protein